MAKKQLDKKMTLELIRTVPMDNSFLNVTSSLPITVLGVGGVGSNLTHAYRTINTASSAIRRSSDVALYDFDAVEYHNCNRGPFLIRGLLNIDTSPNAYLKVHALLNSSNAFTMRQHAVNVNSSTHLKRSHRIFDCRDTLELESVHKSAWIKLAYDGGSNISFLFKPAIAIKKIFSLEGGRNTYAVTPSFFVPALLVSLLALQFARYKHLASITDIRAGGFNMNIDSFTEEMALDWEQ